MNKDYMTFSNFPNLIRWSKRTAYQLVPTWAGEITETVFGKSKIIPESNEVGNYTSDINELIEEYALDVFGIEVYPKEFGHDLDYWFIYYHEDKKQFDFGKIHQVYRYRYYHDIFKNYPSYALIGKYAELIDEIRKAWKPNLRNWLIDPLTSKDEINFSKLNEYPGPYVVDLYLSEMTDFYHELKFEVYNGHE